MIAKKRFGALKRTTLSAVTALTLGAAAMLSGCGDKSAAIPARQQEKTDASLIERGRYLALAGNCYSCHTTEGKAPFAGGVAFETPFGVLYSTNITSDSKAGIGGWTEEEFFRAMRKGIRKDGANLYPAFPFTAFTKTTDEDISAIWAYIRTIEPSEYLPPKNKLSFPANQRWALSVWKMMNFRQGVFEEDPNKSEQWNRGAYLVKSLTHCGACHTPRNGMGAEQEDKFLAGGRYVDNVTKSHKRPWFAVNLTPSPDGLGAWTKEDIALYLKTGHSNRAGVFGPMNEVIANSTQHLTDGDVDAIAEFLIATPPQHAAKRANGELPNDSEILYTIHCGTCHLPTGKGDPTTGPPMVGSAIVVAEDPASLINVILYGATSSHELAPKHAWNNMEAMGEKLTDDEVASISTYVRASWGNEASPVTTKEVTAQR